MKRDIELIKKILLHIESQETFNFPIEIDIEGYENSQCMYHLILLKQAGYIELFEWKNKADKNGIPLYSPLSLTWEGHEFLEASKNPTIWKKITSIIKEKGSSIPFEILKALLISESRKLFDL